MCIENFINKHTTKREINNINKTTNSPQGGLEKYYVFQKSRYIRLLCRGIRKFPRIG